MNDFNARVCVVIPNRNGREHLTYSLPSLSGTTCPSFAVVMVDNCSTDGSPAYVRENFAWIEVVAMREDRGFAGGVNAGIRLALARGFAFVAVFSNDIKVVPEWLEATLAEFERQGDVAVIGYTELSRNSSEPLDMPAAVSFTDVGERLPGPLYVCRADLFERVGLYDEKFFMYGEEMDLFARVRRAGLRILQANVPVWHYGGGFTAQAPFRVAWLRQRNGIRHTVKNDSVWVVLARTLGLLYYAMFPAARPLRSRGKELSGNVLDRHRWMQAQLRPSRNPFVNVGIWLGAVFWNVVFLPQTLMARHRDTVRMRRLR